MSSDKDIQMIMSLTGVDEETASAAYLRYETTEDAIDFLLQKPVVSGDKYIPVKPKVNTGLSAEQEERCMRGRWLQDRVNVVFSVAHSKTRTQPDPVAEISEELPPETEVGTSIELPVTEELKSQQDGREKTILPTLQSASPP